MRKLILQEFISVDGFAADKNKTTAFFDGTDMDVGGAVDRYLFQFMDSVDLILLGAETYRMFVDFWPDAAVEDQIVADKLNAIPKIVFSKSLDAVHWGKWKNASLYKGDAVASVNALKKEAGKNMVIWGSLRLAQSLIRANSIDEIQLFVCPVTLGKGYGLFPEERGLNQLIHTATRSFDSGVVKLVYVPKI